MKTENPNLGNNWESLVLWSLAGTTKKQSPQDKYAPKPAEYPRNHIHIG